MNEILPDEYVADLGEHVHLVELAVEEPKMVMPDVLVARKRRGIRSRDATSQGGRYDGIARAGQDPITAGQGRSAQRLDRNPPPPRRTPVTMIEVLSPTNKTGEGFAEYLRKRRATIRQKVHLVELDLLLKGERLPMDDPLPPGDFFALVSRSEERPESNVYAWTIRDRLPPIPIPLRRPDPDVILDLDAVFATAYDRGRYARSIDYATPPVTVKNAADRAWAQRIAKAARR